MAATMLERRRCDELVDELDRLTEQLGLTEEVQATEGQEFPEARAREVIKPGVSPQTVWSVAAQFDHRWRREVLHSLRYYRCPVHTSVEDVWQDVLSDLVEVWTHKGFQERLSWPRYLRQLCVWRLKLHKRTEQRRGVIHVEWPRRRCGTAIEFASVERTSTEWLNCKLWFGVIDEAIATKLTDREKLTYETFVEEAANGGAKDKQIARRLTMTLRREVTAAAVNKMLQRVRRKLWQALRVADLVKDDQPPRLGSGARIRAF